MNILVANRTVLTIGTFDLFHHGHLRLLSRASDYGTLTVGVNSDGFVRQYKNRSPVMSHLHRCELLAGLRCVNEVIINDGPGIDLIRQLRPDILAVGSDWIGRGYLTQINTTCDELEQLDVSVLFLPRTPGVSTTELRDVLRDRC